MSKYNIILAAGKPFMLESSQMIRTLFFEGKLLEWLLLALDCEEQKKTILVTGESLNMPIEYSSLVVIKENNLWNVTGSAYSLMLALESINIIDNDEVIISYGDILVRPEAISKIESIKSDCVIAYSSYTYIKSDQRIENVYIQNSILRKAGYNLPSYLASGQFSGLIKISSDLARLLKDFLFNNSEEIKNFTIIDIIEWIRCQDVLIQAVDIQGQWAEIDHSKSIVEFIFGTKAETLERLRPVIKNAQIIDQIAFTFKEWKENPEKFISAIQEKYKNIDIIIRSSARTEDSFNSSNAGAYSSLLNIKSNGNIKNSINQVFDSYGHPQLDDQILIQEMLKNVSCSGVVFTRGLKNHSPYYVINYDTSGSTESITSGWGLEAKTLYIYKKCVNEYIPKQFLSLINSLRELEFLLSYDALDVEFAYTFDQQLYILQVRPIVCEDRYDEFDNDIKHIISENIEVWNKLEKRAEAMMKGDKPIFGIMPDWNPAEIIGVNPHALSLSLYNSLIMDETWATQRAEFGYKDVRPKKLLQQFLGKPYVDVRASFNSFIPENVSDEGTKILVDYYTSSLIRNPNLHDKIEFEIVPTCYGPAFDLWRMKLQAETRLTKEQLDQLEKGLKLISCHAINSIDLYLETISHLEKRIEIHQNKAVDEIDIFDIRNIIDECRIFGTLPFAHLARCGFIAVSFLKEAVEKSWLSESAYSSFMNNISTVSKKFSDDIGKVIARELDIETFVQKYGHLRPGTYEITSESYQENVEKYIVPLIESNRADGFPKKVEDNNEWNAEKYNLFEKLRSIGLNYTNDVLEHFLIKSIEGREYAKFIFTKELSLALNWIKIIGERLSLSSAELSHLSIGELELSFNLGQLQKEYLIRRINENKKNILVATKCELPALLYSQEQFEVFEIHANIPNYIGKNVVVAEILYLDSFITVLDDVQLQGKVIMIDQADPGYDWLFGQKIAGLITMYGGVNSHMAIRSAELNLTAAIGAGEIIFNQTKQAKFIELNPCDKTIRILSN